MAAAAASAAAFSGSLAGGQTANTIVALKKEQQIAIEVEARRLGSALDPVIHVYDHRGVPLAWAEGVSALGGDARLDVHRSGRRQLSIEFHDAVYQAGNPGFYRLKIGTWYYAGMVFPPVVQRGNKASLEFAATNLPAGSKVEIDMPANSSDMPAPWPAGMQVAGFRPVVLASDVQETVQSPAAKEAAKETANATAKRADVSLQQIVAPAGFSGRLTAAKEDQVRVAVEPNERLRFEVLAARIGSPVDCVLSIRDEHGNQLASNDDQPGTTDPGLDFNVPGNCARRRRRDQRRDGPRRAGLHLSSGRVAARSARFRLVAGRRSQRNSAGRHGIAASSRVAEPITTGRSNFRFRGFPRA